MFSLLSMAVSRDIISVWAKTVQVLDILKVFVDMEANWPSSSDLPPNSGTTNRIRVSSILAPGAGGL
jgi:hypothetical protein